MLDGDPRKKLESCRPFCIRLGLLLANGIRLLVGGWVSSKHSLFIEEGSGLLIPRGML